MSKKDVILTERSNIAWHQALAAATINAAHSIGRGASHGSLQVCHFYREYRSRCFFLQGRKGCGHVGSWRETLGTPGLSGLAFFVHDMFSCCRFSNLAVFLQLGSRDVIRHVVKKGTVVV